MILCCGEALIDMIPTPTTDGASGFVPHSGGAIFNTAVALGRLGAPVGMLTALSTDMFGAQIAEALSASNVDMRHIIRSGRNSTLAFVQITDGQARYAFFDENTAERMLQPADLPPIDPNVTALYFGGISLARDPGAQTYAELAEKVSKEHVVMLDPNIRAGFIADEARYRARIAKMIGLADIIKVSDEDLAWLYPGSDAMDDKVARLRADAKGIVILTRGADGASGWCADGTRVDTGVPKVTVVDTVGAGDTFNAGILSRLRHVGLLTKDALARIEPAHLEDALGFGAAVAAVTVSRAGANPPWSQEL